MLRKSPFIIPSAPVLAKAPPTGPEWLHEVKHDGFRAQIHIRAGDVQIYGKNGGALTGRFRAIAAAVAAMPFGSIILDAELVACGPDGSPNFDALMRGARQAYVFDLLELDGRSLVVAPLEERRFLLRRVLKRGLPEVLRLSETFDDPHALLKACEKQGLEGIVSKLRDDRYRSGPNRGWIKVKTAAWRASNRERYKLFEKNG